MRSRFGSARIALNGSAQGCCSSAFRHGARSPPSAWSRSASSGLRALFASDTSGGYRSPLSTPRLLRAGPPSGFTASRLGQWRTSRPTEMLSTACAGTGTIGTGASSIPQRICPSPSAPRPVSCSSTSSGEGQPRRSSSGQRTSGGARRGCRYRDLPCLPLRRPRRRPARCHRAQAGSEPNAPSSGVGAGPLTAACLSALARARARATSAGDRRARPTDLRGHRDDESDQHGSVRTRCPLTPSRVPLRRDPRAGQPG